MIKNIVLVGNPNTGKTTLFNSLTLSNEHTGNWHGVTVDSKAKEFTFKNQKFNVVDLPGVYSLSPDSFEEKVTSDFLLLNDDYLIVNILDINNLSRNFYLTLELLELNKPMILLINNMGKSEKIYSINSKIMQDKLGLKTAILDVNNKNEINKLKQGLFDCCNKKNLKINENLLKNKEKTQYLMQKTINLISLNKNNIKANEHFLAKKCLENDENVINLLNLNNQQKQNLSVLQSQITLEEIVGFRCGLINKIFDECKIKKNNKVYGKSKIDKIVLNKYLCLPIFLLTLFAIFYITFFGVGGFLSGVLSDFIQNQFGNSFIGFIKTLTNNAIIISFFQNAIIGGVGAVFSFLPQVVILFLCLGVLEDSGYLSRVAFSLDDIFSKVGLSGKSVYTLLMGFGCSGVASLSARTMDNKNARIKTAMLVPYISCSAKLPIYVVLGGAFFGVNNIFVIFGLYLLGVLVALVLSMIFDKTILKSGGGTFIMEFAPYKKITLKRVLSLILDNSKQFLIRIGSVLVSVNVIIWVLSNFTFTFKFIGYVGGESILQSLGKIIAPIFAPLGFGSWGATSALIAGLVAKEVIVSSIAMFNGVSGSSNNFYGDISKTLINPSSAVCFSPASAVSFMVFSLLYLPCLATLGVLKKEIGKKWLFVSVVIEFCVAYFISLFIYASINLIINRGIGLYLLCVLLFLLVVFAIFWSVRAVKSKKCACCNRCVK